MISPEASFLFRDSRLGGEGIARRIISSVAGLLNEDGFCQLVTNWAHIEGEDWRERIERAFAGSGCNAWVLALDRFEPDVYASRWIQQSERTPEAVGESLEEWMRYWVPSATTLRCFEARELLDGAADEALLEMRPRVAPETSLEQQFARARGLGACRRAAVADPRAPLRGSGGRSRCQPGGALQRQCAATRATGPIGRRRRRNRRRPGP
ncbi:MAG: hypothetical protein ACRDMY_06905 [Gaiellaceae bacterium]